MKFEFSAGGVVYKKEGGQTFVLVSQHSGHHGWVFPKGLIGDKEENKDQTKEETAIREVKEEAGADGEIEKELTPVSYWYVWECEKIKKTVYYFLMKYTGGDITKHDHEMENVEWIDSSEVEKRLTYPSDKEVWEEARKLI
jgi:8-oxo-dGTP pyrophosphatase MutT (NUDIX family)